MATQAGVNVGPDNGFVFEDEQGAEMVYESADIVESWDEVFAGFHMLELAVPVEVVVRDEVAYFWSTPGAREISNFHVVLRRVDVL